MVACNPHVNILHCLIELFLLFYYLIVLCLSKFVSLNCVLWFSVSPLLLRDRLELTIKGMERLTGGVERLQVRQCGAQRAPMQQKLEAILPVECVWGAALSSSHFVKAKTTLLGVATNSHIATNQHGTPVVVGFVLTLYVDFTSLIVLRIAGGHWRSPRP